MRWLFALVLACSVVGCRRAQPPQGPAAEAAPAASTASATPQAAPAPPALPPSLSQGQGEPPRDETADPPVQPPKDDLTLPVIELPPPVIAQAAPKKPEEKEDTRLYSWEDEQGVTQFGTADDVPESRRRSAHVVDSGVTVISAPPLDVPPARSEGPAPEDQAAAQPEEHKARGPEPERDAQGLPIPGTMDDTSATRASRAAGEIQIDPAAVQRRHEEELRRMNCKQKDGVWICG